ncbi:hypothetical protein WSM22_05050 [Cytophagales bacterium WSM2-2]|nr:hypothetical protein WSM22_05050 [Cytophagales bacterium WSM2-2]
MRVKFFLLFLLTGEAISCFAQNPKADSLKNELARHPEQDTVRANILNALAFEKHFSDPEASFQYAADARDLSKQLNYPKGTALAYRHSGLALWTQANLSYALEFFLRGLKIADSLNYVQIQADITGNIGLVYSGLGNYAKALEYYETSLTKQRLLKNRKREIVMLNNVGDCYFHLNQYNRALDTYRMSLTLGTPIDFLMETNNRNIGNVFETMGKLDSAMRHYITSQKLSDRFNEGREKALIRISMASIFLKQRKYQQAENLAQIALLIAQTGNFRAQMKDAYAVLSEIAKVQGQYKSGLEYLKKSISYRDSIQNSVEASRIASLQLEHEMLRKKLEIDGLKKDSQLQDEELKQKNIWLVSIGVGFLLIGVFSFYAYTNYRAQKVLNVQLAELNVEINQQQSELTQQRDKVIKLNEEIQLQQEEVILQRDILTAKNADIESLHQKVRETNSNLEAIVALRTEALSEQNRRLEEYAYINAHKLRAPVASIMGIVSLLQKEGADRDKDMMVGFLKNSSAELDQVIRTISDTLNHGLNAFPEVKK